MTGVPEVVDATMPQVIPVRSERVAFGLRAWELTGTAASRTWRAKASRWVDEAGSLSVSSEFWALVTWVLPPRPMAPTTGAMRFWATFVMGVEPPVVVGVTVQKVVEAFVSTEA